MLDSLKFNTYMKTYTRWFALLVAMLFLGSLTFAQETAAPANKPQEVVVRIQQDAPPPAQPVAKKANEWVEMGTNMGAAVGSAAKAILHETKDATFGKDVSVVDGIDKFSKTDAGRFTMLVVAWKVMGNDALTLLDRVKNVVIGVPFLIGWTVLFIWFYRRNFMVYSVLSKAEGPWWDKTKTYVKVNDDGDWSDAKQMGAAFTTIIYAIATLAVGANIVF